MYGVGHFVQFSSIYHSLTPNNCFLHTPTVRPIGQKSERTNSGTEWFVLKGRDGSHLQVAAANLVKPYTLYTYIIIFQREPSASNNNNKKPFAIRHTKHLCKFHPSRKILLPWMAIAWYKNQIYSKNSLYSKSFMRQSHFSFFQFRPIHSVFSPYTLYNLPYTQYTTYIRCSHSIWIQNGRRWCFKFAEFNKEIQYSKVFTFTIQHEIPERKQIQCKIVLTIYSMKKDRERAKKSVRT